jgi:hypothetical protein
MEGLIKSSDPLLALAGAFFLIGVCFDVIFSREFKDKIRDAIADQYSNKNFSKNSLIISARYLAHEVMSIDRISVFFLKSFALSVSFYVIAAVVDTRLHAFTAGDSTLQGSLARHLMQLAPPVLIVAIFHVFFDFLSAYITVLYLRLVIICRSLRYILLILLSDIFVTATLWSLFFGGALAIHLKIADFEQRDIPIYLKFLSAQLAPGWREDSFIKQNTSLKEAQSLTAEVKVMGYEQFIKPSENNQIILLTNEGDQEKVASILFKIAVYANSGKVRSVANLKEDDGGYSMTLSAIDIIDFRDIPRIAADTYRILSPNYVVFGKFQYVATRNLYASFYGDYDAHVRWPEDGNVVSCDNKIQTLDDAQAQTFDFSRCSRYLITHVSTGKYIGLAAGGSFHPNYLISYKAFFWSSLSLTISYYLVFLSFVIGTMIKRLFAAQVVNNVLNLKQAFFTPLFSVISAGLLMLFIGVKITSQLSP